MTELAFEVLIKVVALSLSFPIQLELHQSEVGLKVMPEILKYIQSRRVVTGVNDA